MTAFSRPRVLTVFGRRSSEHEISCLTATGALTAIDRTKWDVIPLGVTRDSQRVCVVDDPSALEFRDGKGQCVTAGSTCIALTPGEGNLIELSYDGDPDASDSRVADVEDLGHVDTAFSLPHGPYDENGTIQGLFEAVGVRYADCGVTSPTVSMDKHLTKTVLVAAGIDTGRWELAAARQWDTDATACMDRIEGLGFPIFAKFCRVGSSVDVLCVTCRESLPVIIKEVANHDPRIIAEASTSGCEVECGILSSRSDWYSGTTPLGEIVIPEGEFYDHKHKYVDDIVGSSCPAGVAPEHADRICATAWRTFDALECEGLARVDLFFDEATDPVTTNEVNTVPGFTPISMYLQMWAASGLSYSDLLNELLTEAGERPPGLR